jgi:hypothetical protein
MSTTTKNILLFILAIVVGGWVLKLVVHTVQFLLAIAIPVLVIGGIAYAAYTLFGRKALGGGRRTLP